MRNREDLGDRYRLIEIPYTDDKAAAEEVSQCYRDYFMGLDELKRNLTVWIMICNHISNKRKEVLHRFESIVLEYSQERRY